MNISDWILVITSLFLGISAIYAPAISEKIKQKWFGPTIKTSFDESPPYCIKTFYRYRDPEKMFDSIPVFFFRFLVENIGNTKLNNCEAVLEQLWLLSDNKKPKKFTGFQYVNLLWVSPHQPIIDIRPHRKKYCNIGHISHPEHQQGEEFFKCFDLKRTNYSDLRFVFELSTSPNAQPNCISKGKYGIKIVLYSDNAPTKELWYQIDFSGEWDLNIKNMFKELKIVQIDPLE
jgi:hypothetical protein